MTERNKSLWGSGGLRPPDTPADPGIFGENYQKHYKKLDLAERILLVQSRPSGRSLASSYGPLKFCITRGAGWGEGGGRKLKDRLLRNKKNNHISCWTIE